MNKMRIYLCTVFLAVFHFAFSQSDSSKQHVQLKLGLNYNSGLNYFGRTDSLKSTGFFPMAELWLTKELYVNAAPVFVNNSAQAMEYAGTVSSVGYLHTSDKWISNLYVLKPFYKQSSQLVQSALKAQAGASFSRLTKVLNLTVGGDVKFSDKIDYGATAGVDHLFRKQFANNNVLVIDPSFYTYAGTQNFTNTYNKKRNGFLLFPGTNEQVTEEVQTFNVLAYEFSIPVVFARDKWMLLLTPSYILPQNLITVSGQSGLSEQGEDLFYVTFGLKFTL